MQTIYLDISNKGNVPTINAKQGDVGRKFRAIITENGVVPTIVDVETSEFSVWYSGASGNGNYKKIGDRSAFYQEYNTVVVELIHQMLKVPGKGELSLSMEYGGDQIGLWNIPYYVESKPGADSETATDYFDDLANAQQKAEEAAGRAEAAAERAQSAAATDPDRHAEYFTITEDGVISLWPEYRGAAAKVDLYGSGSKEEVIFDDSISNMGIGVVGSQNKDLPSRLVIPEIVDGIVVNSLAEGMFFNNTAIEYVTLPHTIKEIPDCCFFYACRLKEIYGTENITALGERALNRASSLIRANFPSLTSMQLMSIQGCPSLIYADIGKVQTVGEYSLACNINMQRLKNSGDVTGIDPTAFYKCARLKHFENLENLSTIGATGLWGSGIPYTEQAKLADRTLDTYAIAPQVNPTDYWSECTYTPCENPLPTYLAQNNPLWENRAVGSKTYISACMLFDVVHAYCGLHNITLSDVDDLEAMVNDIDPALLTNYVGTYTYQTVLAKGMGLNVEGYGTIDKTVLQTLYDALAAGKYASVTISSGNNGSVKGHCALIYGVTDTGELMFCDCNSVWWHDFTKPYLYSLPIQNIVAHSISGRNTILEIYSV